MYVDKTTEKILTEDGERDISFEDGRVVPRLTRIPSRVGASHLLRVNRLVRALWIQDEMALSTWPRISPVVLVPATISATTLFYLREKFEYATRTTRNRFVLFLLFSPPLRTFSPLKYKLCMLGSSTVRSTYSLLVNFAKFTLDRSSGASCEASLVLAGNANSSLRRPMRYSALTREASKRITVFTGSADRYN